MCYLEGNPLSNLWRSSQQRHGAIVLRSIFCFVLYTETYKKQPYSFGFQQLLIMINTDDKPEEPLMCCWVSQSGRMGGWLHYCHVQSCPSALWIPLYFHPCPSVQSHHACFSPACRILPGRMGHPYQNQEAAPACESQTRSPLRYQR